MKRLAVALIRGVLFALAVAGALLSACGGGHAPTAPSPNDRVLTGTVDLGTEPFAVAPGETVACAGNVVVLAGSAQVEGSLISQARTGAGENGSGLTIETEGDILVTGLVQVGDGVNGAAEQPGGDGGDVTLTSRTGNITIGATAGAAAVRPRAAGSGLHAGSGGRGGPGALGGPGGKGGSVLLDCRQGTLTIHQAAGLFTVGDGGNGGDAEITGPDALTFVPPDVYPNAGGNSGVLLMAFAQLAGAEAEEWGDTPPEGFEGFVLLNEDVLSGGTGGDAGSCSVVLGSGVTPATRRSPAVRPAQDTGPQFNGAPGGDGGRYGGSGGSVEVDFTGDADTGLLDGTGGTANGGNGGDAGAVWWLTPFHVSATMAGYASQGGCGGLASMRAGPGSTGAGCGPGGKGGDATARGGNGGNVRAPRRWASQQRPGDGGIALATGGAGGRGGGTCTATWSDCTQGGTGGAGGKADARGGDAGHVSSDTTMRGYGGEAYATGGAGGAGGNGLVGGGGGAGGGATAAGGAGSLTGSSLAQPGDAGSPGSDCLTPTPPPPDDSISGNTGVSGATVTGSKGSGPSALRRSPTLAQDGELPPATCDDDGYFIFRDVPPGSYFIRPDPALGQPPWYWFPDWRWTDKVEGVATAGVDFERRPATQHGVTVPVRDQNDAPLPGTQVRLLRLLSDYAPVASNAAGNAVFTGIWSGHYFAWTSDVPPAGFRWEFPTQFWLTDSDVTTEPIRLQPQ